MWARMPNGPLVDLDRVEAVETGAYGAGSRLLMHSGHRIEFTSTVDDLVAFVQAAQQGPTARENQALRRRNEQLAAALNGGTAYDETE